MGVVSFQPRVGLATVYESWSWMTTDSRLVTGRTHQHNRMRVRGWDAQYLTHLAETFAISPDLGWPSKSW